MPIPAVLPFPLELPAVSRAVSRVNWSAGWGFLNWYLELSVAMRPSSSPFSQGQEDLLQGLR